MSAPVDRLAPGATNPTPQLDDLVLREPRGSAGNAGRFGAPVEILWTGPSTARCFDLPLSGGRLLTLAVPGPLTADDFERLERTLALWRPALLEPAPE